MSRFERRFEVKEGQDDANGRSEEDRVWEYKE